ncbi:MAG: carboxypeptidase regulatory-like domain-containing protein, partial [Candidatus Rokuibacteriota bacterium]
TGTDSIQITRDVIAPIVRIDSPRDGFVATSSHIAVTGLVNDIVPGGVQPLVAVNGVEAGVGGGAFLLEELELVPGPNEIEAVATDGVGNVGRHAITVHFQPPVGPRIVLVSGNGQSALVRSALPQPLVAAVVDEVGNPLAGYVVRFQVTRNNALLRVGPADEPARVVQVATDGSGRAAAFLTLGDTSGIGIHRVAATAVGVAGEVEFCASGFPEPPDKILMTAGDNQRGVIGHPLPMPLEALVVDINGNPIAGVEVTFTVTVGQGHLDGPSSVTKSTGLDGLVRAVFTLGTDPGINNNLVIAGYEGLTGLPAAFASSGLTAGDPAETRMSGVVLDNAHATIPGARVFIEHTPLETLTDAEGQFTLAGVPVGHIHLIIDPRASPRSEVFPRLAFEAVTVAGQDNDLGQPILIPALDLSEARIVGGPEDVTIKMPGVDGLELTVFANSATFPGGARTGVVSITQVHLDKVPMPPPSGTFFMPPAWTVQPAGVHFDPPARISIPNDGMPAGRMIDIYQFDHELNQFINVGKGATTEDGSRIVSDPGFGITAAGWGGCGQPPPPQDCKARPCRDPNPKDCKKRVGNTCDGCRDENEPDGKACMLGQKNGFCKTGVCQTCPQSTAVGATTPLPLSLAFPSLKTGIGAVTAISASPGNINWDGVAITESLTTASNNCPAAFGDLCAGSSTFTVGAGGQTFGQVFSGQRNTFYDQHVTTASVSALHATGTESCTGVCQQRYSCEGRVIGTHNVTRVFTRDTINGVDVTNVAVTKQ